MFFSFLIKQRVSALAGNIVKANIFMDIYRPIKSNETVYAKMTILSIFTLLVLREALKMLLDFVCIIIERAAV